MWGLRSDCWRSSTPVGGLLLTSWHSCWTCAHVTAMRPDGHPRCCTPAISLNKSRPCTGRRLSRTGCPAPAQRLSCARSPFPGRHRAYGQRVPGPGGSCGHDIVAAGPPAAARRLRLDAEPDRGHDGRPALSVPKTSSTSYDQVVLVDQAQSISCRARGTGGRLSQAHPCPGAICQSCTTVWSALRANASSRPSLLRATTGSCRSEPPSDAHAWVRDAPGACCQRW